MTRYEDMLLNPVSELQRILSFLEIETKKNIDEVVKAYSFETLSKRSPGEESKTSFLRKGISGDWQNYFSQEAIDMFNMFHGEALERLGYD